jgi:hypothetical protein
MKGEANLCVSFLFGKCDMMVMAMSQATGTVDQRCDCTLYVRAFLPGKHWKGISFTTNPDKWRIKYIFSGLSVGYENCNTKLDSSQYTDAPRIYDSTSLVDNLRDLSGFLGNVLGPLASVCTLLNHTALLDLSS